MTDKLYLKLLEQRSFLFSKTSGLALGPAQPPIQWTLQLFGKVTGV
jgi:hypothetical protein